MILAFPADRLQEQTPVTLGARSRRTPNVKFAVPRHAGMKVSQENALLPRLFQIEELPIFDMLEMNEPKHFQSERVC